MVKQLALLSAFLVAANVYGKTLKPGITTLNTELSITHPVYSLSLHSTHADKSLVVLGVDDANQRQLAVFDYLDGAYNKKHQLAIPDNFHVFDFSKPRTGAAQVMYFIANDGLYCLEITDKTAGFKKLVALNSIYLNDKTDFVSRGEFVYDIDKDGQSEFALQQFRNLVWISPADKAGEFKQQTLPIQANAIFEGDLTRIFAKPIYVTDADQDGIDDINILQSGNVVSFRQSDKGGFATNATQIAINPEIKDIDWWFMNGPDGNSLDQSKLSYRRIEHLTDINADGLPDMVVRLTKSGSALDRRNDYELYLGKRENQALTFNQQANSVIARDETLSGLTLVDFNQDQRKEFLLSGFDIGVSQIISALLSSSIDQDVLLFSLDDNSQFAPEPIAKKETELKFKLTSGKAGEPVIKLADLNGDNIKDLVLSDDDNKLRVYFAADQQGFKRRGDTIKVDLPENGKNLTVSDLNGDGRDELVINYGQGDEQALQSRILILTFGDN